MERILALEIGDKRIGLAVSDPFNTYALPLQTYFRKNLKTDMAEIVKIVKEKGITLIVCGLPVNFDGTESVQTKKAAFFIETLKNSVDIPVETADERCTTVEAERVLIEEDMSREKRKNYVDAIAATYILEGYLTKKNKGDKKMKEEKDVCTCEECDHDHCEDNLVEFTDEDGKVIKCFLLDTIEYKGKNYAAFQAAEEIDDEDEDTVYIYEVVDGATPDTSDLIPVEDEALLDEVFDEFCRIMEEEAECEDDCDCGCEHHDHH